jgi:L-ribulose-5-phosphate 4-epimerase
MKTFYKLFEEEIKEIIKYSNLVYWRHLVSAAGGNISIRIGKNVLITASDVSMRDVTAGSLLLCDMDGKVLKGNPILKPSKETQFHLAIYKNRSEVEAVIHAHPCYSTTFSIIGEKLPLYSASAKMKLVNVPIISEATPGSAELVENVKHAVKDYPNTYAYIMSNHGVLTLGKTLKESFDRAELLENTAKIAILIKTILSGDR